MDGSHPPGQLLSTLCSIDKSCAEAADNGWQDIKKSAFVARISEHQCFNIHQEYRETGRIAVAIECIGDGTD